jgi:hypothetical protein
VLCARAVRVWHNFAWIVIGAALLSGCFASHELDVAPRADGGSGAAARPDVGPTPPSDSSIATIDAGCSGELPSDSTDLVCPTYAAPGEAVSVELTHHARACCSDDGGLVTVLRSRFRVYEVDLVTAWDRCSCCEECECASGAETRTLEIGAWSEPGIVVVRAGALSCENAPLAVAVGDDVPVLLRARETRGCGCIPHAVTGHGRKGELWSGIEVCGCGIDPCVDPGYEVTSIHDVGEAPGIRTIMTDAGDVEVAVIDPSTCGSGAPILRSVRIAAPDPALIGERTPSWWAVIEAENAFCCAAPRSYVASQRIDGRDIELAFAECPLPDCDCVPEELTRWEHWHHLGPLAPGRYTVSVRDVSATFDVP